MASSQKCAALPAKAGVRESVLDFLKQALEKKCFDAVLVSAKMPDSDSFTFLLIQDESLLENAYPLAPVISVQGAKAISSITRLGTGKKKIAALMRPCEVRAAVELSKLEQTNLENIFLISIDCPGALPLGEWAKDPKQTETAFSELLNGRDVEDVRPVCQICDKFSATGGEDLHLGTIGVKDSILLIPCSSQGKSVVEKLGLHAEQDISDWQTRVDTLTEEKQARRRQAHKELTAKAKGLDKLLDTFSKCINCHNCMRVCPICYCQHCFFDSDNLRLTFEDYLCRAEVAGGLRLPPETLLFHVGRMVHMSLSCVSCGACEDACPTSIPIAQIFSLVSDRNQKEFNYVPGRSGDEPLPLRVYKDSEFEEVEQSYVEAPASQGVQDD